MKTCIASGTLNQITPSKSATPSKIITQEKRIKGTLKKTIRKRMKITMKTRDSINPEGQ